MDFIFRVHYENPDIKGVSIAKGVILARRIRLSNGRIVFKYKQPIQGYTISPELTTYTRPKEYDVIVTADKKLFIINKIASINKQRKELNVDIMYPDIEYDRQDLQQYEDKLHKTNPYEKWKLIAKVASILIIVVGIIIGLIIYGNNQVQTKQLEATIQDNNLKIQQNQIEMLEDMNEWANTIKILMPDLKELKGDNLAKVIQNGE